MQPDCSRRQLGWKQKTDQERGDEQQLTTVGIPIWLGRLTHSLSKSQVLVAFPRSLRPTRLFRLLRPLDRRQLPNSLHSSFPHQAVVQASVMGLGQAFSLRASPVCPRLGNSLLITVAMDSRHLHSASHNIQRLSRFQIKFNKVFLSISNWIRTTH